MTNHQALTASQALQTVVKNNGNPSPLNNLAAYRAHRAVSILVAETERLQQDFAKVIEAHHKENPDLPEAQHKAHDDALWKKILAEEFISPVPIPKIPASGIAWANADASAVHFLLKLDLVEGEYSE